MKIIYRLGLVIGIAIGTIGLTASTAQAAGIGSISSVTVDPDSVRDGASTVGTVLMAFPDTVANTALLFSSDPSVAMVPPSVIIPAGAISASFIITTNAAAPPTIVQLTAWIGNTPRMYNFSVNPATPTGPTMQSVSTSPTSVTGGSPATGTVKFTAAMNDGAVLRVSSSNTALVQVPTNELVVNARTSSVAFPITTAVVGTTKTVTITATWFSVTRTTTITLTPGALAPKDVVKLTRATWKKGLLRIEATSSNPQAILTVYSKNGGFVLFTLTNNGGGRYSDQRGYITNPLPIIVKSNFGGSAG